MPLTLEGSSRVDLVLADEKIGGNSTSIESRTRQSVAESPCIDSVHSYGATHLVTTMMHDGSGEIRAVVEPAYLLTLQAAEVQAWGLSSRGRPTYSTYVLRLRGQDRQ
nr:hypothetical protein CFP56_34794 [Quercus suber]